MIDHQRIEQLGERHRRVLRLYARRYRLKEIGLELSLSDNSVNTYLTEAVQILGAAGRKAAADALVRYEHPSRSSGYQVSVPDEGPPDPGSSASQSAGVGDGPARPSQFLPLRPNDGSPNRLPALVRVVWMIAILLAVTVGMAIAIAVYALYAKPMEQLFR